jgi:hypothetical protein
MGDDFRLEGTDSVRYSEERCDLCDSHISPLRPLVFGAMAMVGAVRAGWFCAVCLGLK